MKYGSHCIICIHAFKTDDIILVTCYQIEIKLPFRNENVFVLMVLSISFNFKQHYAVALCMQWCVPYASDLDLPRVAINYLNPWPHKWRLFRLSTL